jgi:hypothetical protein
MVIIILLKGEYKKKTIINWSGALSDTAWDWFFSDILILSSQLANVGSREIWRNSKDDLNKKHKRNV